MKLRLAVTGLMLLLPLAGFCQSKPVDRAMVAPVNALLKALNTQQEKFPAELFAKNTAIVDDFAPFTWQGENAARDWYAAYMKEAKGIEDERVSIRDPKFPPSVEGNRAYLTFPTTVTWKEKGKPHTETGHWTLVLEKQGTTWVIAAHTFDVVTQTP